MDETEWVDGGEEETVVAIEEVVDGKTAAVTDLGYGGANLSAGGEDVGSSGSGSCEVDAMSKIVMSAHDKSVCDGCPVLTSIVNGIEHSKFSRCVVCVKVVGV